MKSLRPDRSHLQADAIAGLTFAVPVVASVLLTALVTLRAARRAAEQPQPQPQPVAG